MNSMRITSYANPRIKEIKRLRERKNREVTGLFFAEGLRFVIEAAAKPERIQTLIVAPDLLSSMVAQETVCRCADAGVDVLEVDSGIFRELSAKDGPTGLAAVIKQEWWTLDRIDLQTQPWWVVLENIADPGNLGTTLRTADGAGVNGIILVGQCTDPYDSGAVRASMGALFSQKLIKVTPDDFMLWKKSLDVHMVGTSDKAQCQYTNYPFQFPLLLAMGSEREGLSSELQGLCDAMVSIPMLGVSDSLNLAVATAIVTYEILSQKTGRRVWGA